MFQPSRIGGLRVVGDGFHSMRVYWMGAAVVDIVVRRAVLDGYLHLPGEHVVAAVLHHDVHSRAARVLGCLPIAIASVSGVESALGTSRRGCVGPWSLGGALRQRVWKVGGVTERACARSQGVIPSRREHAAQADPPLISERWFEMLWGNPRTTGRNPVSPFKTAPYGME